MAPINILMGMKRIRIPMGVMLFPFVTTSYQFVCYIMALGITYVLLVIMMAMKKIKQGLMAPLVFIYDMLYS